MSFGLKSCKRLETAVRFAALGVIVVTVVGSSIGCKKKEETSTKLTPEETSMLQSNVSRGAPAPQTQARPQTTISANASTGADLAGLTREVRKWIVRNQRPPSSFEEFASKSGMQIPTPPSGKKYQLTREMSVILVNQ